MNIEVGSGQLRKDAHRGGGQLANLEVITSQVRLKIDGCETARAARRDSSRKLSSPSQPNRGGARTGAMQMPNGHVRAAKCTKSNRW
eukprot:1877152-Pleurochrysis_carterae.AAC.2